LIRDGILLPDRQTGMLPCPGTIHGTLWDVIAAGVGGIYWQRWPGNLAVRRRLDRYDLLHPLALRHVFVELHAIRGRMDDLKAARMRSFQNRDHLPGDLFAASRRAFAPVDIPHVAQQQGSLLRIELFLQANRVPFATAFERFDAGP